MVCGRFGLSIPKVHYSGSPNLALTLTLIVILTLTLALWRVSAHWTFGIVGW